MLRFIIGGRTIVKWERKWLVCVIDVVYQSAYLLTSQKMSSSIQAGMDMIRSKRGTDNHLAIGHALTWKPIHRCKCESRIVLTRKRKIKVVVKKLDCKCNNERKWEKV